MTYYWRARADFQAYAQERLHLLEQISAELNGAQLEIVVDLLLAPPRQKYLSSPEGQGKNQGAELFHVEPKKCGLKLQSAKRLPKLGKWCGLFQVAI